MQNNPRPLIPLDKLATNGKKPKTLVLYTFSGTGVTQHVSEKIQGHFESSGWTVESRLMEDLLKRDKASVKIGADLIGFGSPVYGFGVPLLVRKAVKRLPQGQGIPTFVFRTAGGVAPINYQASKPLIRKLKAKGYPVFHERLFSIASNWQKPFDPTAVARLVTATEKKVQLMCQELMAGQSRFLKPGFWGALALEILMTLEAPLMRTFGPDMKVADSCKSCGLCAKKCPLSNVTMKKGKPHFGLGCGSCLRCLYGCPEKALSMKRNGNLPLADGFNLKDTLENAHRAGLEPTAPPQGYVPPFLAKYETDDQL